MSRSPQPLKTLLGKLHALKSRRGITKIQAIMLVALIIVPSAAVYWYYQSIQAASKEIVIGAPLPLSGAMATIGLSCQRGHDLAVEDINAAGGIKSLGGAKIKIIYGDIKSDQTVAMSETERLIATYHPAAILGAYGSSLTYVATEASERNKVPFLAPMAQADAITDRGFKYVFRQAIRASSVGAKAIDMIVEMSQHFGTPVKTIAIVYENTLWGQTSSEAARKHAPEVGFTIVYDEAYSQGSSDLSPVVTKLKAANPDVVVLASYLNDAILMARTFHELDFNALGYVAMGGGYLEPDFIKSAGKDSEYFFAGSGWQRDLNIPGMADVVRRYEEKYGIFMNEHAGLCYAATWLIKEVLELSATLHPDKPLDADSIREAFLKIDISSGPAVMTAGGRAKFNEKGDNIYGTHVYLQVLGGAQHTVWPFDRASTDPVWPAPAWSER
jgi:branched-chain amino acid transport system substrate-binding protein